VRAVRAEDVLTFYSSPPQPDRSSAVIDKHAAAGVDGDLIASIVVVEITRSIQRQQNTPGHHHVRRTH